LCAGTVLLKGERAEVLTRGRQQLQLYLKPITTYLYRLLTYYINFRYCLQTLTDKFRKKHRV